MCVYSFGQSGIDKLIPDINELLDISNDTNEISVVVPVRGLNADEIFQRVNLAVANNFKSANDVIQLNDKEAKKMVVKAIGEILIPNQNKVMYPKTLIPYPDFVPYTHNYIFNIACRDGRYKMTINFNDGEYYQQPSGLTNGGWLPSPYPSIMNPSEEYKISQRTNWIKRLRENEFMMVGKKRKQKLIDALPDELEKYSNNLKAYAFLIFGSILTDVEEIKNEDDW